MLSLPSKKLARRIKTKVGFEQRIEGYWLRERTGPLPIAMYSFEEVVNFFSKPFPQIDFVRLENWTRVVMEDDELADGIKEIAQTDRSDLEKSLSIGDLLKTRWIQCNFS